MKFVFLLYINRSGSTFLANELSKIKDILVCPEAEILVNLLIKKHGVPFHVTEMKKLEKVLKTDRKLKHWNLSLDGIKPSGISRMDLFFTLLKQYHARIKPGATVILFKAVDLMHYEYPLLDYSRNHGVNISYVILIRDPRGIFNSQSQTYVEYRRRWMNRNPLFMLYQWKYLVFLCTKYNSSQLIITIKYENLITDLKANIYRIMALLGIPPSQYNGLDSGNLKARIPADQLYMHLHIEDLPLPDSLTKWHNELKMDTQDFIQRMAKSELLQLKYPLEQTKTSSIIFYQLLLRFKSGMILKNIYRTFRKIFFIPS